VLRPGQCQLKKVRLSACQTQAKAPPFLAKIISGSSQRRREDGFYHPKSQVQQPGSACILEFMSGDYARMLIVRTSKSIMVAAVALWVSLVAFGNITDYGTNLAFVHHVLSMDTVFPDTTIRYRAIASPALHYVAYLLIIVSEVLAAILCWVGAVRMFRTIPAPAAFARAKNLAVIGLTTCLLIWLVGFIAIGGE
jgi:predicted small integral membrane protein